MASTPEPAGASAPEAVLEAPTAPAVIDAAPSTQAAAADDTTHAPPPAAISPAATAATPAPPTTPIVTDPDIQAANDEDDFDDDEFDPQEVDNLSVGASTSINSSVYEHHYENGRRYHAYKNARYPIPNDDIEQNREDMKHALMLELTDGKLLFSPIGEYPQKIIDIGTGTGIWAIDVADQYPSAEVLGIDFTPIQPVWVPPNLRFIVDDIEQEWLNGSNFDLIHARQLFPVVKNPAKILDEAYKNLKPGGWIEVQELGGTAYSDDNSLPDDYSISKFLDLCTEALSKFGSDFRAGNKMEAPLRAAGFVNVTVRKLKVPIGTWPRDKRLRLIGLYFRTIMEAMLPAFGAKPFLALGMSPVEIEVFLAQARKDLKDNKFHAYFEYLFWTAQKPE